MGRAANPAGQDENALISGDLGVYRPPVCPLIVKHRARPGGMVMQNPQTGEDFIGLTLTLPPLTPGGRAWLMELGKSDFFKDLPGAILNGRVSIVPHEVANAHPVVTGARGELPRESAAAHLNNALQILGFLADRIDAMHACTVGFELSDENARQYRLAKADVTAIAKRLVFALRELGAVNAEGALNDAQRAALLNEIADESQLKLVDGGE